MVFHLCKYDQSKFHTVCENACIWFLQAVIRCHNVVLDFQRNASLLLISLTKTLERLVEFRCYTEGIGALKKTEVSRVWLHDPDVVCFIDQVVW